MSDYPHVPAAFINAIAEEGTKDEAIEWLQKQWNETCALRSALERIGNMDRIDHIHAVAKLTLRGRNLEKEGRDLIA